MSSETKTLPATNKHSYMQPDDDGQEAALPATRETAADAPASQSESLEGGALALWTRNALSVDNFDGDDKAKFIAEGIDVRADVAELAHHGSFVKHSPQWLEAVAPSVVLQSSARWRLRNDAWAPLLRERGVERFVSATSGMVQVCIEADGAINVGTFKPPPGMDQSR